ncbi:MAG: agmatine deiminase family protein [Roseitalea sp.]|nr:agmatine deiminase family protein [Roseitalea sp.]MBO6723893.1 agmatine deiminase family protein [Roseitalea sp.]MBO6745028.1 agmatine deiminase family protein [Roseitalea sp.]
MPKKGGASGMTSACASGFFLPEETVPHERTFMQWPVSRRVHPDGVFLDMLQQAIADIANTIAEFEPVVMLMDASHEAGARRILSDAVEIWDVATDDLWARDSGPMFVVDGKGGLAVSDLNFNGWGGKQVHDNDGAVARRVAAMMELPVFNNGLVGEPGGVETDGHGTLIAHESSWVNPNRNAGSRAEIERLLLDALGAEKLVWAPGIAGADITDHHIDALARFTAPGTILIQMPQDIIAGDPWSKAAFETHDILAAATDARGEPFELVVLPEPYDTRIRSDDFVASYVNYYVCNGAVIAAQFGDRETDVIARDTLAGLYPGRDIVMLQVDPVGEVGGGIHCATREQPRV